MAEKLDWDHVLTFEKVKNPIPEKIIVDGNSVTNPDYQLEERFLSNGNKVVSFTEAKLRRQIHNPNSLILPALLKLTEFNGANEMDNVISQKVVIVGILDSLKAQKKNSPKKTWDMFVFRQKPESGLYVYEEDWNGMTLEYRQKCNWKARLLNILPTLLSEYDFHRYRRKKIKKILNPGKVDGYEFCYPKGLTVKITGGNYVILGKHHKEKVELDFYNIIEDILKIGGVQTDGQKQIALRFAMRGNAEQAQ